MLNQTTFTRIVEECRAILKDDGRTISFPDDDLGELSPTLTVTSVETAAQEVGEFAVHNDFDVHDLLERAWDLPNDEWWDKEWECYEDTVRYLHDTGRKRAVLRTFRGVSRAVRRGMIVRALNSFSVP